MGEVRRLDEENTFIHQEGTSGEDSDIKTHKDGKDVVWTNPDIQTLYPPLKCYVPYSLVMKMRTIEQAVNSRLEFGAYLKGSFIDGSLYVGEEFNVCKQSVTPTNIDFEDAAPEGYNGVIHRHPNGIMDFSGTDRSSINQNHEFSLLYVNNEIIKGIINISLPNTQTRIQLPLTIQVIHPSIEGLEEEIANIKEKEIPRYSPKQSQFYGGGYPSRYLPNFINDDDDEKPQLTPPLPLQRSWDAKDEKTVIADLFALSDIDTNEKDRISCHGCKEDYKKEEPCCPYCRISTEDNSLSESEFIHKTIGETNAELAKHL